MAGIPIWWPNPIVVEWIWANPHIPGQIEMFIRDMGRVILFPLFGRVQFVLIPIQVEPESPPMSPPRMDPADAPILVEDPVPDQPPAQADPDLLAQAMAEAGIPMDVEDPLADDPQEDPPADQ